MSHDVTCYRLTLICLVVPHTNLTHRRHPAHAQGEEMAQQLPPGSAAKGGAGARGVQGYEGARMAEEDVCVGSGAVGRKDVVHWPRTLVSGATRSMAIERRIAPSLVRV